MLKKALLTFVLVINAFTPCFAERFTLTKNDPNPVYATPFTYSYLYTPDKENR